jgi:hypothetical protein
MSGLLFGVGAVAVVVGAVMIGFGIPINEFSFGNTLIISGTSTAVGGLIVIGLGMVVAKLKRLTEALAARAPIRSSRPLEMFEPGTGSRAAPSQVPFPPKPESDAGIREPHLTDPGTDSSPPGDLPVNKVPAQSFAPTLRNPDESPVTVEDEVSLSPQHPMSVPAPAAADLEEEIAENRQENRQEPTLDGGWRSALPPAASPQTRQPQTAYFDTMWPAETKSAKSSVEKSPVDNSSLDTETKPYEPKFDPPPREFVAAPARRAEPESPKQSQENAPRAVAILKSGVVDGMGYTLYVDGSIEAELPQGTLRFASINELRSHLEKNA